MSDSSALTDLIHKIELQLSQSYCFSLQLSANDCLLNENQASEFEVIANQRAAILVKQSNQDELLLALYIQPGISEILSTRNPLESLDLSNLDAFFVLIEELSHFHLIANRASSEKTVTQLELEWQGEMDKILIAGKTLLEQTGRTNFRQLAMLAFEGSITSSHQPFIYQQATYFAAACWYKIFPQIYRLSEKQKYLRTLDFLRASYNKQWPAKVRSIFKSA